MVALRRSSGNAPDGPHAGAPAPGSWPPNSPPREGGAVGGAPEPGAVGAGGVVPEGPAPTLAPPEPRAVPHSMQNFAPGGFSVPHEGQLAARAAPQDMQNRARSGFSVPQLGHTALAT